MTLQPADQVADGFFGFFDGRWQFRLVEFEFVVDGGVATAVGRWFRQFGSSGAGIGTTVLILHQIWRSFSGAGQLEPTAAAVRLDQLEFDT